MCKRAGRICRRTTRWRASHTLFPFLSFVDRVVCTLHATLFLLVFPPGGSPLLRHRRGGVLPTHRLIFSFFFVNSFFLSFPPEALSEEINEAVCIHMLPRYLSFFHWWGWNPPPFWFVSPPVGGILFFLWQYRQQGQCMTHAPLSLCFSPFIGVFFFPQLHYWRGGGVRPTCCSLLSHLPLINWGEFFFWQLLNTQGHCTTHMLPLVYPVPSYILSVVNILNKL